MRDPGKESRRWPRVCRIVLAGTVAALSCAPTFAAGSLGETVIQIDFAETHDRLPPDERLGIVGQHQIVATLSAGNR